MTRRRRSSRRIQIGVRIAAIVRTAREGRGWTKTSLGERTGISRQMIAAVESGQANPSLDIVAALLDGLDVDLELLASGPVTVGGPRRTDAAHAICSAYVQRRLESAGWQVAREVRIEDGRYVGWIDLLAFHEATGTLLVIEIKTRLDDVGAIERSVDWHLSRAHIGVARLGWRPRKLVGWLLALATDEVEESIGRNRAIWAAVFPGRAAAMMSLIGAPAEASVSSTGRALALIDPRSRRRDWLIRTRSDGRRSASPYRGYADFMSRVGATTRHCQWRGRTHDRARYRQWRRTDES